MDGSRAGSAMIREAGPADFPAMIELGAQMHAEGRYADLPYDRDKLMKLAMAMHTTGRGLFLMAEQGETPAGMLIVYLDEYFFCSVKVCRDLLLWVRPTFRGGLLGKFMVEEAEKWAKPRGAHECSFGVSNGGEWIRVSQLLERLGYTHDGNLLRKRL